MEKSKKKEKIYILHCSLGPYCRFKTIGNWKAKMIEEYYEHWNKEHMPKPIIHQMKFS